MSEGRRRRLAGARLLREIFVVVSSILIAFALDAWWDGRAARRTEAAHLRSLRSDFEQNVERLRQLIAMEEQVSDASRRLLLAAGSDAAVPQDTLRRLLRRVFNSARFDPVMGGYQAVVGSGGLAQITDDSLRKALAGFASLLESRYSERYSDELYFDFIRSFTGRLGMTAAALRPGTAAEDAPVRRLIADDKFREHLALRHFAERDVARAYRALLAQAERVLALLPRPDS